MFNVKKSIYIIALAFLSLPFFSKISLAANAPAVNIIQARVMEITKEEVKDNGNGQDIRQQNLSLKILEGEDKGKIVQYEGISEIVPVSSSVYKPGDKVLVAVSEDDDGNKNYFVTDYVRTPSLLLLLIVFLVALFLVGGKGRSFRAILSLVISALVIIYVMVPLILNGTNPIIATLVGSIALLLFIVYLSEGFSREANLAAASMGVSLLATILISFIFVKLSRLSGVSSEESAFLVSFGTKAINLKGILLSGIIIGALGVLDDVVISQIAVVRELKEADNSLTRHQLYSKAIKVGRSHISSMTNTLFLAYAGAALPLLIMLASGQSGAGNFVHVINNEDLATEIIRTLAGSLGLILAVPIATFLAARSFSKEKI